MPLRFEYPCPPLTEVFAFHTGRPCRAEEGSQASSGSDPCQQRCPYERECEQTAAALPLDLVYRGSFKVTLAERSSTLIVRSEHQYSRDDRMRMSLRKHIHELNSNEPFTVVLTDGIREAVRRRLQDLREESSLTWAAVSAQRPSDMFTEAEIERLDECLRQMQQEKRRWLSSDRKRALQEFREWIRANTGMTAPSDVEAWAEQVVQQLFAPMRCHELTRHDQFGKYLGFVDLRLNSRIAPLAMGLLVAPRHLRHDPAAHYIVGEYSSLFGAAGFASTVYTMHEPKLGGACCGQACVIMATGILADRGAQLHGSYELTYLAKSPPESGRNEFDISGLNFQETVHVLNDPRCRTTAVEFRPRGEGLSADFDPNDAVRYWRYLGERLIEAYVMARFPIILFVDASTWNDAFKQLGNNDAAEQPGNHAVVVVGFRRTGEPEEVASTPGIPQQFRPDVLSDLIVHDPSLKPYAIWPTDACFFASTQFKEKSNEPASGHLNMVFVADHRIKVHAFQRFRELCECVDPLRGRDDSQLALEYWTREDRDLRFALLHRDDVESTYFYSKDHLYGGDKALADRQLKRTRRRIRDNFPTALVNGWYWAIAGYQGAKLRTLWLCNTQRAGRDLPWEWRFDVDDNGRHLGNVGNGEGVHLSHTDKDFCLVAIARQAERLQEDSDRREKQALEAAKPTGEHAPTTDVGDFELTPSVITSSSDRALGAFIDEVGAIDRVNTLDLFLLRQRDILDMTAPQPRLLDPADPQRLLTREKVDLYSSADLMAVDGNVSRVQEWIAREFQERPAAKISAFATYFPQIVNESERRPSYALDENDERTLRDVSIEALANTVCLGLELKEEDLWLSDVIVEMVCGSKLDEGESRTRVKVADDDKKIQFLLRSLTQVVKKVHQRRGREGESWALGLETEPGDTYVLRDHQQLGRLVAMLDQEDEFALLRSHVGLNVDIAHMRMAGVPAGWIRKNASHLVVHAHITDHPLMHTRDQRIGGWMPVDRFDAEEYEFLFELAGIGSARGAGGLPFSGCIALELEGCGRISWIHSSLNALRQMCEAVKNYPNQIDARRRGGRSLYSR
jgi:hypothetical protein